MGTVPTLDTMSGDLIAQMDYKSASRSMFGDQVNSKVKSAPSYGMGTSYHNQHVFISQEHEKCNFGRIGPGPAHYNQRNTWNEGGRNVDSMKKSCATSKFGTGSRFYTVRDPRMPSGTPGPGHYRV